ncbi:MAG TPA: hypothetical protein VLV90_05970 [Burkholderiales bacterium]|nr:hypothetical protein [Burkholderiales bacterium]
MFEESDTSLGWQAFTESLSEDGRQGAVIVWELRAMEIEAWGRKRREPVKGPLPAGYLILTEQGRIVAAIGCGDANGAAALQNAALFRGNFPGAGRYRIDNGRLITRAPEGGAGADAVQSRDCSLDGRWLEVAGVWSSGDSEESGIRRFVFGFQKLA